MTNNPSIKDFIQIFASEFDEEDPSTITASTEFRQIGSWSSMQALLVMTALDNNYGATLSAEEIKASTTVEDLYNALIAKLP